MGSNARRRALFVGALLLGCGAAATVTWQRGMWGSLAGALLVATWQLALLEACAGGVRRRAPDPSSGTTEALVPRLLLDAAPTPLLGIEPGAARALNRAARRLFATDDRVLPLPSALLDATARHMQHEGRSWRIDRVSVSPTRSVAALVDVEQEERAAEARATAEMIHVLGHELLNGIAPIASLAESGVSALRARVPDAALLAEILATLSRRAEGLQRFGEKYRALARLPEPVRTDTDLVAFASDLARLFAGRWPDVPLSATVTPGARWSVDRDQLSQAVWALLQNAAEALGGIAAPRIDLSITTSRNVMTISVSDNGIGLPAEAYAWIFHPFRTSKPGGSGVGLTLARRIVIAHGGMLTLSGQQPTCFLLTIPARRDFDTPGAPLPS